MDDADGRSSLESSRAFRGLIGLAALALTVIVLAGAKAASDLVAHTLLGLVLAAAVTPVLTVTVRVGWGARAGAILASLTLFVVASAFAIVVGLAGSQMAQELRTFRSSFGEAKARLEAGLDVYDLEFLMPLIDGGIDLSRMDVLPRLVDAALSVGSAGYVTFVALFTLFEAPTLQEKWRRVAQDERMRRNAGRVLRDVQRYLLVKTGTCLASGLMVGLWTAALGLDGFVLWGLLAFAFNYIPFIGALLAFIPPTLVALVGIDLWTGMAVGAGILVVNFLIGNVIEPRVMGRAMGLSPLVVLLSVAVWGWVLGPIGALLSVPLTVIAKLALERSDRYAWLAVLMESPAALEEEVRAEDSPRRREEREAAREAAPS
ncbi:MAG: AI-2E family transporter [Myxococcota bacterium]